MRSTTNPALVRARTTRLPLTAGNRAEAILGGDGHSANLGAGINRNSQSMATAIFENGTDSFPCVRQRFVLAVALGHDLGKRGHKDGESASFLRFENDRKAMVLRHYVAPSVHVM